MSETPHSAHTIVVGSGSTGAAVAGLLAERGVDVLLLESGPDYGCFDRDRWPAELLDARALPITHQWGYEGLHRGRAIPFERARVIGGCSSHNGCAAIWGHAADYDGWAALGNPGWSAADLRPFFLRVSERLRVVEYAADAITPFQGACLDAAAALGWPLTDDLNDLDEDEGMAAFPVNVWQGVRWNAAFAYLDPVRGEPNLRIEGDTHVERILLDDGVAKGVVANGQRYEAERVVVAGGTYASPQLLLRSGIGPAEQLAQPGVEALVPLDGVGANLQDHPMAVLHFAGTPELEARMRAAPGWVPEEQTLAKLRSPHCEEALDVHVAPIGGATPDGGWRWELTVACMDPRSRGSVTLCDPDSLAPPTIDNGFLTDPEGHDRQVLAAAVDLARELAAAEPLRSLIGEELEGPLLCDPTDLAANLDAACTHYFHPVGTCAMGPDPEAGAVVDADGKVHGVDGLYVADCSIMPTVPRGNTNLPAVVVGEAIAERLARTRTRSIA